MAVLIKGMEMPTSCRACHLKMNCDDCEGWECVCVPLGQEIGYFGDLLTDKRRNDCPLVHVPTHRDLIDRDKLEKDIDKYIGGEESRLRFHHWVQVQSAVIPGDKGEET